MYRLKKTPNATAVAIVRISASWNAEADDGEIRVNPSKSDLHLLKTQCASASKKARRSDLQSEIAEMSSEMSLPYRRNSD
ncbi:hypothetical protein F4009_02075 [Candidatus Poribacteria bacterium]|nr:hypothetical protein [Candidatus Poribacteria bacterium]